MGGDDDMTLKTLRKLRNKSAEVQKLPGKKRKKERRKKDSGS